MPKYIRYPASVTRSSGLNLLSLQLQGTTEKEANRKSFALMTDISN